MQITTAKKTAGQQPGVDFLVLGVYADKRPSGPLRKLEVLQGLIERGEFKRKAYELLPLYGVTGLSDEPVQVLLVGLGNHADFNQQRAYRASSAALRYLAAKPRAKVACYLDDGWTPEQTAAGVAGAIAGAVGQDLYRAEKKRTPPEECLWPGHNPEAIEAGIALGESINLTRRLINEPAQMIYPESFAQRATEVAAACGLEIEVWDQPRLESERCGSLLSVAKGSDRPPRLVIVRYSGGKPKDAPIALVGKGVTFDSGGLSLKPSESMLTMKCDMSGAATVLGTMQAIARLKLPVNVIGLMGLVENMTGGSAMKLGDVLTARSGKTIEVHNTDAEGRLVLADVLNVAVEQGAAKIIDLCTVTLACVVALGTDVAGVFTNDQSWADAVLSASRTSGEPLWQLPMFPEYGEQIRGEVADIKNLGEGRWGGAITAAKFLEEFVGGKPWVHLDIAGPAFYDKPRDWAEAGAAIRLRATTGAAATAVIFSSLDILVSLFACRSAFPGREGIQR